MRNKIEVELVDDARKKNLGKEAALEIASKVKEIYSCKGSKIKHIDLQKENPSESELLEALLGPTGNLRAPTMRVGKQVLVGFNEDLFKKILKDRVAAVI